MSQSSENTFQRYSNREGEEQEESKSDVETLITRVHEYYERLNEQDQDEFFSSEQYIDAGKYQSIGRDLNMSHHERRYSPDRVPLAKRNMTNFPRPMNLEKRIHEKNQSPEKYR
jgi:hypothetical protein